MRYACLGAAEKMPSDGPHRKSFNLLQFSPCVCPVKYKHIHLDSKKSFTCNINRNKTNLLCEF